MRGWIRESRAGKSLFATGLLLALLLRAFVPTGYMPAVHSTGIVVELCSGTEGAKLLVRLDGKAPAQKTPAADDPCVFAVSLGQGLLAGGDWSLVLPALHGLPPPLGVISFAVLAPRLAAPPPPPRGPPLQA